MSKGQRALLPPDEEERLQQLAKTGSDTVRQRAMAILAWHEGLTAADTARRTKLTENQIRYLWRQYSLKGLDLFMVEAEPIVVPPPEPTPELTPEPDIPGTVSLEDLCATYHVDLDHAQYVGKLAVKLFDATINIHRLSETARPLLEAAALIHNVAVEIDQANHHLKGRDILLEHPLKGFTDDERKILACTTAFHRKKIKADTEPAYRALSEDLRRDALALSALLRIADGLDNSQSQSTTINNVQVMPEEVLIVVEGPSAYADAEQAQKKADLWHQIFTTPARITKLAVEVPALPARILPEPSPTLDTSTTVAKAGRTFVMHTLDRIDSLIKPLHNGDTSVLTALVREASRLSEAAILADAREFRKEIGWLYDVLEQARFTAALAERLAALEDDSEQTIPTISAKIAEWETQARLAIQAVDTRRYTRLSTELRQSSPDDVDPNEKALLSFHVGSILWGHLTALRGVMEFSNSVDEALEAARRLQDHLIAFRKLLGGEVAQVLDMLAPLESYLSAIQLTQSIIIHLEPKPIKKGRKVIPPTIDPAAEALRNDQLKGLEMLAEDLPAVWSAVNSVIFRRALAMAIAAA